MNVVKAWFQRHLADPQVVILATVLLLGFFSIFVLGRTLTPALASVVIAYLLEGVVDWTRRLGLPRRAGVFLVFGIFLALLAFVLLWLLPILSRQVAQLVQQLPSMIAIGQQELLRLPDRYPEMLTREQVLHMMGVLSQEVGRLGQGILSLSLEGVRSLMTVLVYLVLMPLLVFFFLKDKELILEWFSQFLPTERGLTTRVWRDVDVQIANYVRGKVWEILLVWVASYVTFTWLDLDFSMLLSLFVGLSVLVPYVGATVMVLPIALIGYFDFGFGSEFAYVLIAYGIIQLLDGNLLAPLLLSEVVNLHPVAIIVAVLTFGGVWGFWGVFFAIPLATLVQAILEAWPRKISTSAKPPPEEPPSDPVAA